MIACVMRRFRAILLLSTLLIMPASIFAASVLPGAPCSCDCGPACPMHRNQKSHQEQTPCQGTRQSQSTCSCGVGQRSEPAIPRFVSRVTIDIQHASFLPTIVEEVRLADSEFALTRFVSPPEQPPRS